MDTVVQATRTQIAADMETQPPRVLNANYLVAGAGAGGMAFVDTLLSSDPSATVVLVDRRDQAGGHWVDAYDFVRLHQPANAYGVASRKLELPGEMDLIHNLSSKPEILAYYRSVLDDFLATGRVTWFPCCSVAADWRQSKRFDSLAQPGLSWVCGPATRCVDATYSGVTVPSTSSPVTTGRYAIAPGAPPVVPINALARLDGGVEFFVVVGAGKTGIDAVLWLLSRHVEPARIRWIVPRDSWMFDRRWALGIRGVGLSKMLDLAERMETASSVGGLTKVLQDAGMLFSLDPTRTPERNRGAQVTAEDIAALRRLEESGSIVRAGHVVRVEPERLVLKQGELSLPANGTLVVDASADGLAPRPPIPVFGPDRCITLQALVLFLMPISAAVIARVEASFGQEEDATKNALCVPVPHPVTQRDFVLCMLKTNQNRLRWRAEPKLASWYRNCRLNWQDAHLPSPWSMIKQMVSEWRRLPQLIGVEKKHAEIYARCLGGEEEHSMAPRVKTSATGSMRSKL